MIVKSISVSGGSGNVLSSRESLSAGFAYVIKFWKNLMAFFRKNNIFYCSQSFLWWSGYILSKNLHRMKLLFSNSHEKCSAFSCSNFYFLLVFGIPSSCHSGIQKTPKKTKIDSSFARPKIPKISFPNDSRYIQFWLPQMLHGGFFLFSHLSTVSQL